MIPSILRVLAVRREVESLGRSSTEESVKFMTGPALQIVMANPSEALSRSTTDPLLVMVIPSTM